MHHLIISCYCAYDTSHQMIENINYDPNKAFKEKHLRRLFISLYLIFYLHRHSLRMWQNFIKNKWNPRSESVDHQKTCFVV